MRKVLVLGTVLVTSGVSAGVLSTTAQASAPVSPPGPAATASSSATPGAPGTPGVPGGDGATTKPDAGGKKRAPAGRKGARSRAAAGRGSVTAVAKASAVMVTPPLPNRRTYAYGHGVRAQMDVYWRGAPGGRAKAERRPAVLLLHGGSWLHGDKRSWRDTAAEITRHGYVVFAANYRFISQAQWPAQRDDALAAVDYVKHNAARFGIDPERLVVVGSSAGGHLATMLGTYGSGTKRVRGVVALSPVASPFLAFTDGGKPDATALRADLRKAVVQLVGCVPVEGDAACWPKIDDAASATHASADDAPMLIMHSQNDFVPATQGMSLRDALARFGVPVTVKVVPGSAHGAAIVSDPQNLGTVITWIDSIDKR